MPYLRSGDFIREETLIQWGNLSKTEREDTRPKLLDYAHRDFERFWSYFDRPLWLKSPDNAVI